MAEPSPPSATSRPVARMVLAGVALTWNTGVVMAVVVDLILSGWRIPASPLWSFAITAGAILTVSTVMVEVGARIVESRQRDTEQILARLDLLEERSACRYAALNGGQVEGIGPAASIGYSEGYADGLARRAAAPAQRRLSPVES